MKRGKFFGVYPALVTPFRDDGSLDLDSQKAIIRRHLDAGVHGLAVIGSNGENAYLSMKEKKAAVKSAVSAVAGRVPVIVGVIEYGTDCAIELASYAKEAGADGILAGFPSYFKVGGAGALAHYSRLSGLNFPILYYNFPVVMDYTPTPADIGAIFGIKNVVGVKESVTSMRTIKSHMKRVPAGKDIAFFAGYEFALYDMLVAGGVGLIGGVTNVAPEIFVEVYEEYMKGRKPASRLAQEKIFEIAPIFFGDGLKPEALKAGIRESIKSGAPVGASDGVPICVTKEAMRRRGYPVSPLVRDPLPPLKKYQKERVVRVLKEAGLLGKDRV